MEACVCPAPAALTTIVKQNCKVNLLQIQRWLFQRAGYLFDSTADPAVPITALASWTPLFAAVGATKVVSTPLIENWVFPRTEAVSEGGGDNTTIDGIEIVLGGSAVRGIGQIAEAPGTTIAEIRKLMCETDIVAYGINSAGAFVCVDADPDNEGTIHTGIPIRSLFVSDADNNGLNTRDKADISFGVEYGWRDNVVIVQPAFNAKNLWPA